MVHCRWLLFDEKIYIPTTSPVLLSILSAIHNEGHEGVQKTLHRLKADFHVPRARQIIQNFLRDCLICQRNKQNISIRLAFCNLWKYLPSFGKIFSWILWRDYLAFMASQLFSLSSIGSLNMRISFHLRILTRQSPSVRRSLGRLCAYTTFLVLLLVIATWSSRVFFGRSYFSLAGIRLNMSTAYHPQFDG